MKALLLLLPESESELEPPCHSAVNDLANAGNSLVIQRRHFASLRQHLNTSTTICHSDDKTFWKLNVIPARSASMRS